MEVKQRILKSALRNSTIPFKYKVFLRLQLVKIEKKYSLTRHRNRCLITGRVWNVLKKVQFSRFAFRKKAHLGDLPGVSRLSR